MSYLKQHTRVPQRTPLPGQDPGMFDVVGFDTATPQLIFDFARGAL